jgi:hypothetical protein
MNVTWEGIFEVKSNPVISYIWKQSIYRNKLCRFSFRN